MKYGVKFKLLTLQEQMEWVEKQTKKVLARLPTLKKSLRVFDDRSSDIYNLTAEEIKLSSKVYSTQISEGTYGEGIENYIEQLQMYGSSKMSSLVKISREKRIASFLENIKSVGGEEEYKYAKKLLNSLTKAEQNEFVKSKYFFDTGNLSSDDFVKFINDFDVSVGTAKLESFMASIGKLNKENARYFKKGETRIKLGRPKKRGRKRKRK